MAIALILVILAFGLAISHGLWLARRLPEPADGPSLGKLPYAALHSKRRTTALILMTATAQLATFGAPVAMRPLWLIYGATVAALVWVDACTTWLPASLSWLVTVELLAASAVTLWLSDDRATLVMRLVAGAGAALAIWWALWRFSRGGLGFGDVRLAPLTGAMAATLGASGWFAGLLIGSALGVVWGLVIGRRYPAPGTKGGFAYGPALWAGPYAALALSMLSA